MLEKIRKFASPTRRNEEGASAVEYGLLVALIAAVVVVAVCRPRLARQGHLQRHLQQHQGQHQRQHFRQLQLTTDHRLAGATPVTRPALLHLGRTGRDDDHRKR